MIRKSRKSALEHYQVNAGGEYVYTGSYMAFLEEGKSRKRALGELWVLTGAIAAAALGCGLIPAPGAQNAFYVLIPLMVTIITAIACLWTLGQTAFGGNPMKEYIYRDSVMKMKGRYTAAAIFAGITCVCELLYLAIKGAWGLPGGAVCLLSVAVCGLSILARNLFSTLKWEKSTGKIG